MLKEVQRDQGLTVLLLISAAALAFLVVRDLGAGLPDLPSVPTNSAPVSLRLPVREFEGVLNPDRIPLLAVPTNQLGSFLSAYFQPAPKPKPPPPTTRKIDLTYLGFFQAGERSRQAVVQLGDQQVIAGVGSNVVADLSVAGMELRTLTLTNPAAQSHILHFNVKTNLEVPIQ